jgi:hypothetical protein
LIDWYLSQQDLDSEEALRQEGRLVRTLISRLVNKDFVLIAVTPEDVDAKDLDERVLFVNPNFNIDGN